MPRYKNIVVLTGSGISADSGIATFRDKEGIWSQYDIEDVATPEAFARDPVKVHEFYNTRRRALAGVEPNRAHFALARLEREHTASPGRTFTLITQNIDHLHEASGSQNVIHMHGELMRGMCASCRARFPWAHDMSVATVCPGCGKSGNVRPDVVWFGETPYHMDRIVHLLGRANLFISIGTSGTVYPAASFVEGARSIGAHTVELNLEPSEGASMFHEAIHGNASEIVPAYVKRLLRAWP